MRRERITVTLRGDLIKQLDLLVNGKDVKNRSNAIEHLIIDRFQSRSLKKAVIVGRTHDLTLDGKEIAKVLIPISGKTLIEKNIQTLSRIGITKAYIVTGKWKKEIENVLGSIYAGVEIIYCEKKYGTAGILKDIGHELQGTFLMANNDILLGNIDMADIYQFHKEHKAWGTVAVTPVPDPSMLGSIFMKGDVITDFREKVKSEDQKSLLINAGVYILEPEVMTLVKSAQSMIEHDVFPLLAKKDRLLGYQLAANWVHLHDEKLYGQYLAKKKKK